MLSSHLKYNVSQTQLRMKMGRPAATLRWTDAKANEERATARGSSLGMREATEGRKKPLQNICRKNSMGCRSSHGVVTTAFAGVIMDTLDSNA